MITLKKILSKKIFLLSIFSIASGCNQKIGYNKNAQNTNELPITSNRSIECPILDTQETIEDETIEIRNVKSLLDGLVSEEELQETIHILKKSLLRDVNDVTSLSELIINLEEILIKYDNTESLNHIEKLLNISNLIKTYSDQYLNEINRITKENYRTLISYKKNPTFGMLQSENFSIENYLISLEAVSISKDFNHSIKKIKLLHNLDENYVPLLHSVNSSSIKFLHIITGKEHTINIESEEDIKPIIEFSIFFNQNLNKLNPFIKANQYGILELQEIEAPYSLNAGIAIKTIMDYFETEKYPNPIHRNSENSLSKIIKVHAYVNLLQIGVDNLSEANKTLFIFKSLSKNMLTKNLHFFSSIGKMGSKINVSLNAANIILDAIELYKTENATQKIKFGTALAFDSVGLGMGLGSPFLSWLEASTASSALSTLAIPFTGLAIGLKGFADAAAQGQEESVHLSRYFYDYEKELKNFNNQESEFFLNLNQKKLPFIPLAYKNIEYTNQKIISADYNNIMISALNLSNPNSIILHFGDHYIYQTSRWESLDRISHSYISSFGPNPGPIHDKQHLIPIRNLLNFDLGIKDSIFLNNIPTQTPIMLPIVPITDISYDFHYTPGIMSRHDAELSSLLKMQKNGKFIFEYMTGIFTEMAIRSLYFEYKKTNISVSLGNDNRVLITSFIPNIWHNLITYDIQAKNGQYYLKLSNGINYNILSASSQEGKWVLDLSSLNGIAKIYNNKIVMDNTQINFPTNNKPTEILLMYKNGAITKVNLSDEKQSYSLFDYRSQNLKPKEFKEFIYQMTSQNRQSEGFIEIKNYPIDENSTEKAWYDIKEKQILFPNQVKKYNNLNCPLRSPECFINSNNLNLIGRNEKQLYFYDPINLNLYYQKDLNSTIELLETSIKRAYFHCGHVIAENEGLLLSIKNPFEKTLLEIKKDNIDRNEIHSFYSNNNYKLNKEILLFTSQNQFYGWYLSNIDTVINIPKLISNIKEY